MDRGLECGLGLGGRRMGVGGSEEINLLLLEAFLIDFSSICNASTFSRDIPIWHSYP
jgi:hypothetical protein